MLNLFIINLGKDLERDLYGLENFLVEIAEKRRRRRKKRRRIRRGSMSSVNDEEESKIWGVFSSGDDIFVCEY